MDFFYTRAHFLFIALYVQLCITLRDHMDCSPPGCSVHGIFQEIILECATVSYSRGSSQYRDQTCLSCTCRWILFHLATWKAHYSFYYILLYLKWTLKKRERERESISSLTLIHLLRASFLTSVMFKVPISKIWSPLNLWMGFLISW